MNFKFFALIFLSILFNSCLSNKTNESQLPENSTGSTLLSEMGEYDWSPEGFRQDHPDEWVVVKQVIDLQQKGEFDYGKVDSFVREYIISKKIDLPKDKYLQIKEIEKICKSEFDIDGYDNSNMGMHIADGTSRLFDGYIDWLFACEASKVEGTGINLEEESALLKSVITAFYNCCDSISLAFEGSGGWHGWAYVHGMEMSFNRSMSEAILNPQSHKSMPYLLTPKHFEDECDVRFNNYHQEPEIPTTPQTVRAYLDEYCRAIKSWLEYRGKVETGIPNPTLKADYSYLTRSFAREQYIHLKNDFGDIGMMSPMMVECCLPFDCSDEEMLNYSFEETIEKYLAE